MMCIIDIRIDNLTLNAFCVFAFETADEIAVEAADVSSHRWGWSIEAILRIRLERCDGELLVSFVISCSFFALSLNRVDYVWGEESMIGCVSEWSLEMLTFAKNPQKLLVGRNPWDSNWLLTPCLNERRISDYCLSRERSSKNTSFWNQLLTLFHMSCN